MLGPLLDLVSAFSYEPQRSDGELYQKIVESYRRDEVVYARCMGSLTGPKERNMRMLLRPKNQRIVEALNGLLEIPAMMEQLLLGNMHKWLALHIDEQIIHYIDHISAVWKEGICERKKTLMQSLDVDSVRIIQFRMPTVCPGDADTIKRLFDNGKLFPGVTDTGDREMLQRNVLSLDMVIPSFETLQENMHYVGFAAKILVRHVVDGLPLCKGSKKPSPTIFEVLSSSWTAPEVAQVETDDGQLTAIEGPASPSLAFTQLCLACLRLFPWLQDALPPREDPPQDSFKADINTGCVAYILKLAFDLGFRTSKIQAGQSQPRFPGPKPPLLWQEIPDWRGGRPFTRTFWYLRTNGFLLTLAATRRRQPNPEFVLLDMMTAFFGKHTLTPKHEPENAAVEDALMDDYVGEGPTLGPEDEQEAGAPVSHQAPSDKIRPRSRHFGSAAKAAHASRQNATGIPRREAARSIMGQPAGIARRAATDGGVSKNFAQALKAFEDRQAAPSTEAALAQPAGSLASQTSQDIQNPPFEPSNSVKDVVPSGVTLFGREAARSVFVAEPNREGRAEDVVNDIAKAFALTSAPTQRRQLGLSLGRQDQESSREAAGSVPTRDDFRVVIPPIRGMKPRKLLRARPNVLALRQGIQPSLGKHPRADPDSSTIRQEEPEDPVPKRTRRSLIPSSTTPPVPPSTTPPVPPLTRDRQKRIGASEQRKRHAMIWGSREGGGPSNPLPIVEEEEEL